MKTTLIQEQDKIIAVGLKGGKKELKAARARFAKWCKANKVDFIPALYDAFDMVELQKAAA